MSKIDDLIAELCPNGVIYKPLSELGEFFGGLTGKSKDDFTNGNSSFITYKNVYSNPALDIDPVDTVKIAVGERQRTLEYGDIVFTGSSETPDECGLSSVITKKPEKPLYLNSFSFFFRFNNLSIIEPDFAKHLFRSSNLRYQIGKTANGVTRFNVSKKLMGKVVIPIPPLSLQNEIIRILDNFLDLTTELTAELAARKTQYEYYRDKFYGHDYEGMLRMADNQSVKILPLSEVGTFKRGKRFVKADSEGLTTGVPCLHYGELYTYYGVSAEKSKSFVKSALAAKLRFATKGDIVIVGAGENNIDIGVGVAWFGDEDIAVHDACYTLTHNQNSKYISYYLRTNIYHNQIKKYVSEGKICSISASGLGKALIPIPSLEEQERIVSILDNFEVLTNDNSTGLTAEIAARQKQYEYYRDKLLTFEQLI